MLLWERIEPRLRDIARRAGVADVPPTVVAAGCVLCALACVWALWRWWPRGSPTAERPEQPVVQASAVGSDGAATSTAEAAGVFVHVVGAVRHPGLYELKSGSRVADAIDAAGGMLPDAVAAAVNLARPVSDGEQVMVPDEDDRAPAAASGGAAGAAVGSGASAGGPVDLNSADAALLDTLPGVGPSTAAKIIAEREANGPFASVEDLARVSGIGPKKLEQLAGVACVR